ncbi:MAG: AraC family transcriptional regulator, partial [Bacteroidota bacterium]
EEHLNIPLLCEELGVSRSVLFAKFRAWTDQTPKEYIVAARMRRAARLLESGKYQVSEVCYRVGYRTPSYFGKAFRKHFSLSPREYAERFTGSGAQKA